MRCVLLISWFGVIVTGVMRDNEVVRKGRWVDVGYFVLFDVDFDIMTWLDCRRLVPFDLCGTGLERSITAEELQDFSIALVDCLGISVYSQI